MIKKLSDFLLSTQATNDDEYVKWWPYSKICCKIKSSQNMGDNSWINIVSETTYGCLKYQTWTAESWKHLTPIILHHWQTVWHNIFNDNITVFFPADLILNPALEAHLYQIYVYRWECSESFDGWRLVNWVSDAS